MNELRSILQPLSAPAPGHVLATLVAVAGSSYRRPGARLLLSADGLRFGSISGGCLEEDVIARARHVRETGAAEVVVYDTTSENDLVWGVGLGCHGVVHVLIEPLPPSPSWAAELSAGLAAQQPTSLAVVWRAPAPTALGTRLARELPPLSDTGEVAVFHDTVQPPVPLVIFGAGDDARPLARLAQELGWHVTVADPRPAFATRERFPTADALVVVSAEQLVARTMPSARAAVVVMTHHYIHDVPLLRDLLPRPLAYLGLLGPRKRAERILADLGVVPAAHPDLHAPVGLDLGAETPAEVALSIVAEIQATLAGRDARSLRHRAKPIHA